MITMNDIAREAGVSRYTVSKILNGDSTVKPASRDRVMAICARHGYVPNHYAVGLVRGSTNTIAMIVPYITDDFYNEMIELTEREATKHGYRLIYQSSYNDAEVEANVIKNFLALQVCAMIVTPTVNQPDLHLHRLMAAQIPVIYFDRPLPATEYLVANDHYLSSRTMTEYLLAHQSIPFYLDSFYGNANSAAADRRRGYEAVMREHGLIPEFIPNHASREQQDNERFGYENLQAYLASGSEIPAAVFCVTDAVALGAMLALREAGLVPGRDIRIAGHDHLRFGAYLEPTLTTMRQPKELFSRTCIELADQLIRRQQPAQRQYIFPSELVVRKSA